MDRAAVEVLPVLTHEDADWERAERTVYVVRQTISYQYPSPIYDLRQRLVVVPPPRHGDQHTLGRGLDASLPARRREWQDRFGNTVIDLEVDTVETTIEFEAWALIERRSGAEPPRARVNRTMEQPTPLTTADRTLSEAADELAAAGPGGVELAERVCDWVHQNMVYRHDTTSIHTTAATALALGAGVCQDYAHIALALCRHGGLAARYVSGHLLGEGGSHAWIEVLAADRDRPSACRPVALDPTHKRRAGLTYLTVATGRDYRDVAPLSGTYRASVSGHLSVRKQAALVSLFYRGDGHLPGRVSEKMVGNAEPQVGRQAQ